MTDRDWKSLKELNLQRGRLTDLLTALERVRAFVDEHGEADRVEALDMIHRYSELAVVDLMHVCEEGEKRNAEVGCVAGQWRFL